MLQNQDISKQLKVDMLIATTGGDLPKIGKVQAIPSDPKLHSIISVHWMVQERAPHKPKWQRYFRPKSGATALGNVAIQDIILYGFDLTKNGALKKQSREYLQKACSSSS